MTLHLSGIILAKEDWRENDRIIFFYSQELGLVKIFVRGARRINSKLTPLTSEPFALLKLVVALGKNRFHLIGGQIKEHFKNIIKDEQKIIQTNALLKRINGLIKRQSDKKIFFLILKFLKKIDQIPLNKIAVINNAFLIKFLAFLGYCPEVKYCLVCRKLFKNDTSLEVSFNLNKGGVVCLPCQQADLKQDLDDNENNQSFRINQKVLKILQKLLYQDFDFLIKQDFIKKDFQTAEKIIKKFFDWHLVS